jgi:hypothetical protein
MNILKTLVRVVLVVVGLYTVISTIVNLSGANPHWQADIRSPGAITGFAFTILLGLVLIYLAWKFSIVESVFKFLFNLRRVRIVYV